MKITLVFNFLLVSIFCLAQPSNRFEPADVFDLEYASDPRMEPDGERIIYVRNFKDVMTDANLSNLWMVVPGKGDASAMHIPVTTGKQRDSSPRWSKNGTELVYISSRDGSAQIYRRWLESGAEARLTNLTKGPGGLSWSPDNKWIAFSMFVPEKSGSHVKMPDKPDGAKWSKPPTYIDDMYYRADGGGYLKKGFRQVFVLSIDGGTPRQLTTGPFRHGGRLSWTPDSKGIVFSANRHPNWEHDPINSEVHHIDISNGQLTTLTTRQGPDGVPTVSPDGSQIAYLGFDDQLLGYQLRRLYVMNSDGSLPTCISADFDRSVGNIQWAGDGNGLFFQYDEHGDTKIAHIDLNGNINTLQDQVGGLSLGRPYSGGTFHVNKNNDYAYTTCTVHHPADVAVGSKGKEGVQLTALNDDLFTYKQLGEVEEIWYESSFDKRKVQGWIVKPPDFDPNKKYPLLLEIHGGPFANYGSRFSAEIQLYAAAGYVVLYTNPRGSTSYGAEFGNLIHHNYPGQDYDDLMSGVDAVIVKGYIDENQLYVTGGSGGGVLTSWIVGHTNRFRAAVVAKPVINWYSFVLNSDSPGFFYKYWFPGPPWDHMEHYMARSPISYVGNVKTPTMLLTGEEDYRTPISESEQFYAGLKINNVDASLVRIPGASHGIANKPSHLIAKVNYITGWFEEHKKDKS
ncbi:MAG: S9 family peptidase [Bacteroidetes bacterium]|nr:MAG: S9 family peptidase [Bacteroidota bacterium]